MSINKKMAICNTPLNTPCGVWEKRVMSLTQEVRRRDLHLHLGLGCSWKDASGGLSAKDVNEVKGLCGTKGIPGRVFYQAVDHFLRTRVEPFQAMLTTWMNGAKAQIKEYDVPFTRVITWCQDTGDNKARRILSDEVRRLCRFLAPFSHATWKVLLTALGEELGYPDYLTFCQEKRGTSLCLWAGKAKRFLKETDEPYLSLVRPLLKEVTGLELEEATRFDAIYLLGLRYLDHLFPDKLDLEKILGFFRGWGIDLSRLKGLEIHTVGRAGCQSYCIPEEIPHKVHVVLGPIKGWLDLESLFHELGHALSFIYTDPSLSPAEKDFFPSGALSETFAFLFQKMSVSRQFLAHVLGLSEKESTEVSRIHSIKWLALTRRYAAKLVIEAENFKKGWLTKGQDFYSLTMHKGTGFQYYPETYLFDLMPDFYSLDYFQAYLGAAVIGEYLDETLGPEWSLMGQAGDILKHWWAGGNRLDLPSFLEKNIQRPLEPEAFFRTMA